MPPTNGLTSAAGALRYWERRQEIVSHNLANASTDGFKGERVFARLLGDATPVVQTATDLRAGTLRETHDPLDLALEKADQFLVVKTPNGERFSRGGAFHLSADRTVVDAAGNPVLGENGPITVPPNASAIEIAPDGAVKANGQVVDRLRVERPGAGAALQHEGGTLLIPDAGRQAVAAADRGVRQGAVEESNVNPIGAMVDMIAVQRAYASIQKAITTMDGIRGTAATELGKPV